MPKEGQLYSTFVDALLRASDKAAHIAQKCRAEDQLFQLLIEEKSEDEKNNRFLHDFKTLADVLVQEVVRHDLCLQFPGIGPRIRGEESNLFTNVLGETVCVQVLPSEAETSTLLSKVLDGNLRVAALLAQIVFAEVPPHGHDLSNIKGSFELEDTAIWIDPIDSTSEYIHGKNESPIDSQGLVQSGLQCACILIGAYNVHSGAPSMGVVNQPFSELTGNGWISSSFWGVCGPIKSNSLCGLGNGSSPVWRPLGGTVVISANETSSLVNRLKERYRVIPVAGAGYKLLAVAKGQADFYLLSKGSTYKWDTCGPHALIRSLGEGGIVNFRDTLEAGPEELLTQLETLQLTYNNSSDSSQLLANSKGILAYRSLDALIELVAFLCGACNKYSEMEETAL